MSASAARPASPAAGAYPPQPITISIIAAAALGLVGCFLVYGLANDEVADIQIALLAWVSVPYVAAGLVAWWRRPESRLGVLMLAGGFACALSALQFAEHDLPYTIGASFDVLPAAVFLHVYLAFPEGRLRSWFERGLVGAAYVSAIGLQLVKLAVSEFGPNNLLEVSVRPDLAQIVARAQLLSLAAFCLIGIAVLALRRRTAGPPLRRSLALLVNSFALALLMIAVLFVSGVIGAFDGHTFQTIQRLTLFVVGLAPIVFLIAILDARLARSAVGDLVVELRTHPAPDALREALARALRDPSLRLAYWLPDLGAYADLEGRQVEVDDTAPGATLIEHEGARVAALIHDPALGEETELRDAVGAAAGIALENGRLHAELRARLEELRGSRARVIDAGLNERQRLERNLHDGAQQRLIALSLDLSRLEEKFDGNPVAKSGLVDARREIALSLQELRDVARGLHPAVLSGHGLEVALESIVARAAVPVRFRIDLDGRLPDRVEVAAYYVVSESLVNVAKHAQATTATVDVVRGSEELVVEVVDDGIGGADSERGSGLRGLADRVESLNGRLRVWTPLGGGTRVRAEIPCA